MSITGISMVMLALSAAAPPNPNPWEKAKESKGIVVYARDVPNSRVREVKASTVVATSTARVHEVVLDMNHYIEFMPYVEQVKLVGKQGDNTYFIYYLLDLPLVSRRDYTIRLKDYVDKANSFYQVKWVEANNRGPGEKDGVVRITVNKGSWTIEPIQGGKATRLTYWLYTDPGGSIPAWIANKANTVSLPDLLTAVKKRSLDPTWKR